MEYRNEITSSQDEFDLLNNEIISIHLPWQTEDASW